MATHTTRVHSGNSGNSVAIDATARLRQGTEPLNFRERRFVPWLLAIVDLAGPQLSLLLASLGYSWLHLASPDPGNYHWVRPSLLFMPIAYALAGLYPGYGLATPERLRRRIKSCAIVFACLAICGNFIDQGACPHGLLGVSFFVTAVLAVAFEAAAISSLARMDKWGTPVVVLSSGHAGIELARTLRRQRELGLRPIALFKESQETWGTQIDGIPVVGSPASAANLAGTATTAVIAMPSLATSGLARILANLPFARVIVVLQLSGMQSLWVTACDLGGTLGLNLQRNLLRKSNYYLKRTLDYAAGIPLLLLSAPLIAVLALWVKRVSPGPAFYCQEREGHQGKTIRIWKLRTMFPDAEAELFHYLEKHPDERREWQRFFKLKHDPRILPRVGHLLRKTSLDELPQLWNVIRGDLSLVGPRPFPRYHMESFDPEFRELRRSVVPGITGFWQISARSDGDLGIQEMLDTYYIRNWSLWLDAYIFVRTIAVVLLGEGAY